MKTFLSASHSTLNSVVTLVFVILILSACRMFSPNAGSGNTSGTGWKVWVKTSPCAGGRTDWISVAKTNPSEGGGGSSWQTADLIQSPAACTRDVDDCTFAAATAAANTIRASDKFASYCCRDYSVWRNSSTGEMTAVVGKQSTAGFGWMLEKADLCCEEAAALSGKTAMCDSSAPPLGPNVARTPRVSNTNTTTYTNSGTDYNRNGETVTSTPYPTQPPSTPYSTPAVSNRWTLVSVTAMPETPDTKSGWSYGGAQASSANAKVYTGTTFDFQWTKPPQQIDENGFTISLNIRCQPQNEPGCSGNLGVSGSGIESNTPRNQWVAEANGSNGAAGSGQKSVTFKPSSSANEIEVEIGMMWGAVRFVYKYQRAQ